MFAYVDCDAPGVSEYLAERFPEFAGAVLDRIAVVSPEYWRAPGDVGRVLSRRAERALVQLARDAADCGQYCAQDRAIRAGVRLSGGGAVEVTFRHAGEHVVCIVGIDAQSIRASQSAPEALRHAAESAEAEQDVAYWEERASSLRRAKRRAERACRMGAEVIQGRARPVKAWRIPGTPEAGRIAMIDAEIARAGAALEGAAVIAKLWAENPEGGCL